MDTVLNIKTCNYLLTSMIRIKELVLAASENNIKSLGIADNNMYGVLEFYKECKFAGIKPIIGLEVMVHDLKLVLYAESYKGYQNLLMITSFEELTISILLEYSDDVLCVMPYKSNTLYDDLKHIYKHLFIGFENVEEKELIKLGNKVFMRDILCIDKEDEKYLKYLHAIRDGVNVSEKEELVGVSLLPISADANSKVISDLCNVEIKFHGDLLPVYPCDDSYEYLKQKCILGLKKKFGSSVRKIYQDRLKYELSIIKKMGFCDYFLIVSDYVNYAKESGILVGPGRGSAAGSLVSFLLNITTIDPLKYDLLFERFLNPDRVTMPDIDVDFEDTRREEVIRYCAEKYGDNKTGYIITFGTLKAKAAVRDVGRAMSVSLNKIDLLCRNIDVKLSLKDNLNNVNIKKILNMNNDLKKVYLIAMKFENLKRHTSVHAAGVVISKCDLRSVVPIEKKEFGTVIGYDKDYLEELGLLKMDFLGLKNLSLIDNILKSCAIDFDDIPLNDKDAIKIFTDVSTVGIFQFESSGMVNFLKKLKPNSFDEIAAALALFRPGPMKNIDLYIKRRNGLSEVNYYHEDLKEVLSPTYGVIIYQEQIMQIASILAGYSMSEADNLRRAMSKKKHDVLLKEKDKFIGQSVARGYDINIATEVYDLILRFAEYGFNKSHTISYAMVSYKMAYLKAHYPKIFMKHLLDSAINSDSKTRTYIYECKKFNVFVTGPDINESADTYVNSNGNLVFPFTNIKGIGINNVTNILKEREKGLFKDIFDFAQRCDVPVNVLERLIMAGCFDRLGYNRKTLTDNINVIRNYADIAGYLDEGVFKPELNISSEYSDEAIANEELSLFGFYLSNHPIVKYKNSYNIIPLSRLSNYFDKRIRTVIYAEKVREINTKNNEKMAFITASDEVTNVEAVIFPKLYKTFSVGQGDVLLIDGKVEKRFDKFQIIINSIQSLK